MGLKSQPGSRMGHMVPCDFVGHCIFATFCKPRLYQRGGGSALLYISDPKVSWSQWQQHFKIDVCAFQRFGLFCTSPCDCKVGFVYRYEVCGSALAFTKVIKESDLSLGHVSEARGNSFCFSLYHGHLAMHDCCQWLQRSGVADARRDHSVIVAASTLRRLSLRFFNCSRQPLIARTERCHIQAWRVHSQLWSSSCQPFCRPRPQIGKPLGLLAAVCWDVPWIRIRLGSGHRCGSLT